MVVQFIWVGSIYLAQGNTFVYYNLWLFTRSCLSKPKKMCAQHTLHSALRASKGGLPMVMRMRLWCTCTTSFIFVRMNEFVMLWMSLRYSALNTVNTWKFALRTFKEGCPLVMTIRLFKISELFLLDTDHFTAIISQEIHRNESFWSVCEMITCERFSECFPLDTDHCTAEIHRNFKKKGIHRKGKFRNQFSIISQQGIHRNGAGGNRRGWSLV